MGSLRQRKYQRAVLLHTAVTHTSTAASVSCMSACDCSATAACENGLLAINDVREFVNALQCCLDAAMSNAALNVSMFAVERAEEGNAVQLAVRRVR